MKHSTLAIAAVFACTTATVAEARFALPTASISNLTVQLTAPDAAIIQIKDDKGKRGKKKAQKANKQKYKAKKAQRYDKPKKGKANRSKEVRARDAEAILQIRAPDGRDMLMLLGALPLALLGSNVIFSEVPKDRLLTYRNCPPGLAKKDPPCVPPGLAKKGVTYDEWVSYDDHQLDGIWHDHRTNYLDQDELIFDDDETYYDDSFLLNSAQIASLYGLRSAPHGSRYALIDGQPVLLTHEDYRSLLRINELARVDDLPANLRIAPTAALTQNELRQTYNLPAPEPGYNYAVVNGKLVILQDSAFETLQLIRIARAVF